MQVVTLDAVLPIAVSPPPSHAPKVNPGPLLNIWDSAPSWLVGIALTAVAAGALVTAVQPLWNIAVFVVKQGFKPIRNRLQSSEEAYRVQQRRGFARYVVSQLERLAVAEDWRDDRFAELEAEVEVQGRERIIPWLRFSPYRNVALRREKSLSKGLARTTDNLVILEGDPGSGKSVALRHLAEQLARKAQKSDSCSSLMPLYVNLKEFRPAQRPVDANAVRDFIVESLTRAHDRNADQFINDEFDRGMLEGTWLLLLDSFDEIPDVLSSTDSDNTVVEYAMAIREFLTGMRNGRAIVASREFRGPAAFDVPQFRIVALTTEQQADLIKKSGLKPTAQDAVHAGLAVADPELRLLARNPMFLGLVCEYVRSDGTFPPSSHAAYDSFLEKRLTRDEDRLRKRYGVGRNEVRLVAEEIAFCMTAMEGLGLSPARAELRKALAADGRISLRLLDKVLDALEYTKLGRAADDPTGTGTQHFTFAHRRFQEYFATRVVLRAPDRVPVRELLTNGRWRETAVTILQIQPAEASGPLLAEAALLLAPMTGAVTGEDKENPDALGFPWPPGSLHLLQLLDTGLGRAPENLGPAIRGDSGLLLRAGWGHGRRHDRKWAVSVALTTERDTTIWLVEQAFESRSVYLGGAAYTVVSRMDDPPESLYQGVRQTLLAVAAGRQLKKEHPTLKAQISRLPNPVPLQRVLRLLTVAPTADLLLAALIVACSSVWDPWSLIPDAILIPATLRFPPTFSVSPKFPSKRRRIASFELHFSRVMLRLLLLPAANISDFFSYANPYSMYLYILVPYFVLWPIFMLNVCIDGRVPRAFFWPFLPVYEFIYRAINFALWSRPDWKEIAEAATTVLGTVSIVGGIYGAIYLWAHVNDARFPLDVLGAVLVMLILYIIIGVLGGKIVAIRERRRISRTLRALPQGGPLRVGEILGILSTVHTERAVGVVLKFAAATDLARSPSLERALSDIAAWIENPSSAPADLGPDVAHWVATSDKKTLRAARNIQGSTLDMIARSVEQAELSRQRQNVPQ